MRQAEHLASSRGDTGHVFRPQQIAAPELQRILTARSGRQIHEPLGYRAGDWRAHCPKLTSRYLVLQGAAQPCAKVAKAIRRPHCTQRTHRFGGARAGKNRIGSEPLQIINVEAQDSPLGIDSDAAADAMLARVNIRLKRFQPVRLEADGPTDEPARGADANLVWVDMHLQSERPTDITADHPNARERDAE